MRDLIWTVAHPTLTGAERCVLSENDHGWRLSGRVVASLEGAPVDVEYAVEVDPGWVTRRVVVAVDGPPELRGLEAVRRASGNWSVDGVARPELDGATDVDLGITPSTNTLPIRRLQLDVGEEADVHVAWVRFPDLRVDAGRQRYARIDTNVWRYSSSGFTADLVVDDDGLVVQYGDDLWRQEAR